MNDTLKNKESWKGNIVDFFENKVSKSKLFKARDYIDKKVKELKKENNEKRIERLQIAKQKKQDELELNRKTSPIGEIRDWIDKTSKTKIAEGKRIIKATHVLKFSHGASASDGLLLIGKSNDMILTTSSLNKSVTYDLAHNNGALITISRFLALKCSGKLIFDMVQDDDFSFFNGFYKDNKQLEEWKKGFSNCVEVRDIKNTDKAKQLFFPTLNSKYHIIVPLYPSSLSEEIYSTISQLKFGEVEKIIRKQINKGEGNSSKYHTQEHINYPNIGVLNFGGAQPQNISMLNKNRGGNCYLLTSQPPSWQSQLNPPTNKKSFFDYFYPAAIKEDITYLRDFLTRNDRIELSIKNPQKLEWIEKWVNSIIEEVFYYISTIQNLPSGWTSHKEVKLKQEHKYLLDPYRDDEQFQALRKEKGWQKIVCKDFSNWLNSKLKGKDNKFTPQKQHTRLWSKLFETSLREDVEEITWDIKYKEEIS